MTEPEQPQSFPDLPEALDPDLGWRAHAELAQRLLRQFANLASIADPDSEEAHDMGQEILLIMEFHRDCAVLGQLLEAGDSAPQKLRRQRTGTGPGAPLPSRRADRNQRRGGTPK
jgi:hypothetical protein